MEMQKVGSLVGTARRLLDAGTMVDLSALEGKVRLICDGTTAIARADAQRLRPDLERLIDDLDQLADLLKRRRAASGGDDMARG